MNRKVCLVLLALLVFADAQQRRVGRRRRQNQNQNGSTTGQTLVKVVSPSSSLSRSWGASFCHADPERERTLPDFPAGTKIRVDCPEGYAYVTTFTGDGDDRRITCQSTGQWNKKLGSCKRVGGICDRPETPEGGVILSQSAAIDESPNKFSESSFIAYDCLDGFIMSGRPRLTCMSNSQWDPPTPPSCRRDVPPVIVIRNPCYMPASPTNGDISVQSAPIEDGTGLNFAPGARITYRCNTDYEMSGMSTIRCQSSGRWDRNPPTCSRSQSNGVCSKPRVPPLVRIVFSHPASQPSMYPVGGRIRFSCYRGFTLYGAGSIECLSSGRWSNGPPDCR